MGLGDGDIGRSPRSATPASPLLRWLLRLHLTPDPGSMWRDRNWLFYSASEGHLHTDTRVARLPFGVLMNQIGFVLKNQ